MQSLSETRARSNTTGVEIQLYTARVQKIFPVVIATGFHLFPFRTEKLSPTAPMVLHTRGRVGRRHFTTSLETRKRLGALLRLDESEGMGKGRRSEKTEGAQETVARRGRICGRLWAGIINEGWNAGRRLIYNVCLVEREQACNCPEWTERGYLLHRAPFSARITRFCRGVRLLHLVLFSVRQSSEFLSVRAFSFEECLTANCKRRGY